MIDQDILNELEAYRTLFREMRKFILDNNGSYSYSLNIVAIDFMLMTSDRNEKLAALESS